MWHLKESPDIIYKIWAFKLCHLNLNFAKAANFVSFGITDPLTKNRVNEANYEYFFQFQFLFKNNLKTIIMLF
jgi:hypothetical protein